MYTCRPREMRNRIVDGKDLTGEKTAFREDVSSENKF